MTRPTGEPSFEYKKTVHGLSPEWRESMHRFVIDVCARRRSV